MIGLKSNWREKQLLIRLGVRPPLIELHLGDGDLENARNAICDSLAFLQGKGIVTTIHQPHRYRGLPVGLAYKDKKLVTNSIKCYELMRELCEVYSLWGFVAHPYMFLKHTATIDCKRTLLINLLAIEKYWKFLLLENNGESQFANMAELKWIACKTDCQLGFCLDISHLFMYYGTNAMIGEISCIRERIRYLHISDSNGHYDGLEIGTGSIDLAVLDSLKGIPGVIEVRSKNEEKPTELLNSWTRVLHRKGGIYGQW